jgi:hypothetical protein
VRVLLGEQSPPAVRRGVADQAIERSPRPGVEGEMLQPWPEGVVLGAVERDGLLEDDVGPVVPPAPLRWSVLESLVPGVAMAG